ncbi:MAG: hypothetical protein LH480_12535 [Rubrivivax sp.]|nr:hypothetical protein [Rubrivivax sp.]
MELQSRPIRHIAAQPPCALPPGHVGLVTLPGTSREIWWTGRVAIGLRFEGHRTTSSASLSAEWLQRVLLSRRGRKARSAEAEAGAGA